MKIFNFCKYNLLFLSGFTSYCFGSASNNISYDSSDHTLLFCEKNQTCHKLTIPTSLRLELEEDDMIFIIDPLGTNKTYLLATPNNASSVNACYLTYLIENNVISSEPIAILPNNQSLCLYQIEEGHLINRYRDGAKWYEERYQLINEQYQLKIIDECVGCDFIKRTIFDENGNMIHFLVSDDANFEHRKPITTTVMSKKVYLYSAPNNKNKTMNYLSYKDQVTLLDMSDDWIKVEYINKKKKRFSGWINANALHSF